MQAEVTDLLAPLATVLPTLFEATFVVTAKQLEQQLPSSFRILLPLPAIFSSFLLPLFSFSQVGFGYDFNPSLAYSSLPCLKLFP